MLSNIVKHKRDIRLPQDSGEWRPVPLRFRMLPPPPDPLLQRKLLRVSILTAFVQGLLLAGATWVFFEYFSQRDLPGLMAVATTVGLVPAMIGGLYVARHYWLDAPDTIGVLMRGQAWWGVLLLVPVYGWSALFALGVPCVLGVFFGAGLGAKLGRREDL